jgi:hypothetical protein
MWHCGLNTGPQACEAGSLPFESHSQPQHSVLTLNINGLYSPIKRHRKAGWIKKQNLTVGCPGAIHLTKTNIDLR